MASIYNFTSSLYIMVNSSRLEDSYALIELISTSFENNSANKYTSDFHFNNDLLNVDYASLDLIISNLDKIIGDSFTVLSVPTKVLLLASTSSFNAISCLDLKTSLSNSIVQDLIGYNGIGLLNLVNPITNIMGRTFAELLLRYFHINNTPFQSCFIDMMALKSINDLGSQAKGDLALKRFAVEVEKWAEFNSKKLIITHWGGDEFLIINTDNEIIDLMSLSQWFENVKTEDIYDVSSRKVIELYLARQKLFTNNQLKPLLSIIKKIEFKRLICNNLFDAYIELSYMMCRNVGIMYLLSILAFVLIYFPIILIRNRRRESDRYLVFQNTLVKQKAKEIIPQPQIRFVGFCQPIIPSNFARIENLINYINNCPEVKQLNRSFKQSFWKTGSLEAIILDIRGEHLKRRASDR
jgi:GGDEF domain-containing protein